MRITLVGPAHPWRGGIPLLVAELAHRLSAAGHDVRLQTWSRQGPARLLPAQRHRLTAPEAADFSTTREPLSWRNPVHWWRRGRQIGRRSDLVVLVHYTPVQAVALSVIGWRAGRQGSRRLVLCANAVPHESRPGDRHLTTLLMRAADAIVVHTEAERAALTAVTDRPVAVTALPPHLPVGDPMSRPSGAPPHRRLLFFGKVRHYKGVDILLRALARFDDIALRIVGEVYPDAVGLRALISQLELVGRVEFDPGYLPAEQIPVLFSTVDALVLPYRSATASQMVALAFWHGAPAIVSRVGNFPDAVRDGVDGLICEPDDVDDLARSIRALYEPGRLRTLSESVHFPDAEKAWAEYLDLIEVLGGPVRR